MYDLMFVFTEGSPEVADPNAWQSCNIFDAGLHISVIDTRRDILNIYEKYVVVSATIFLMQYIYKELSFRRYSQCMVKCL